MFLTIKRLFCFTFGWHTWNKVVTLQLLGDKKAREDSKVVKEVCKACGKMRTTYPKNVMINIARKDRQ